jgi:hypothetical protein
MKTERCALYVTFVVTLITIEYAPKLFLAVILYTVCQAIHAIS